MKRKCLIVFIIFAILIYSEINASEKRLEVNCKNFSNFYIDFKSDKEAIICVNSSHIYINAKIKKKDSKTKDFTLISTYDLGRGGMSLKWGNYSLNKKILTLVKINDKKYLAYWYGFFDKKKKKYVWTKEADLIKHGDKGSKKGSYYLYICDF